MPTPSDAYQRDVSHVGPIGPSLDLAAPYLTPISGMMPIPIVFDGLKYNCLFTHSVIDKSWRVFPVPLNPHLLCATGDTKCRPNIRHPFSTWHSFRVCPFPNAGLPVGESDWVPNGDSSPNNLKLRNRRRYPRLQENHVAGENSAWNQQENE